MRVCLFLKVLFDSLMMVLYWVETCNRCNKVNICVGRKVCVFFYSGSCSRMAQLLVTRWASAARVNAWQRCIQEILPSHASHNTVWWG